MTELVKMGTKGQLVVPKSIREQLGLRPKDRFIAMSNRDYIFFKKVTIPSISEDFEKFTKMMSQKAKKKGITKKDIEKAIEEVRKR